MSIKEELENIWNSELKDKFTKTIDSTIEEAGKCIEKKLNNYEKNMMQKMDIIFKAFEKERIKTKMNHVCTNLVNNNNNNLLNAVLICLCNIEPLVFLYIGSEKNNILEKINNNNKNNYLSLFSLFKELMDNLWMKKENQYNSNKIYNQLGILNKNIYKSNNPADIMSFILSKLNEEMNFNKNKNIDNKNKQVNIFMEDEVLKNFKENIGKNQTTISKMFFVNYKIKKTCEQCQVPIFFYEQKPLINLYIQEKGRLSFVIEDENKEKELFKDLSLSEIFSFLLNDNEEEEGDCEICNNKKKFIINNTINDLNNDILIINLNRDKDPNRERNIEFSKRFELKVKEDKNVSYDLISVLKDNYSDNNTQINLYDDVNEVKKYRVYCKNFLNGKWFKYGDEGKISEVKNEKIVLNSKNALLLIYKKIKI